MNRISMYGPIYPNFNKECPRYALTSDVSHTIELYVQSGHSVRCVDVTFSNPAKCVDLYEICNSINLDYSEFSEAALISQNKEIRDALIAKGFDCFYDHAILENEDPLQFVPFYPNQVEML